MYTVLQAQTDDECRTILYDTETLDNPVQYILYEMSKCDCLLPGLSTNGVVLMKSYPDQSGEIIWSDFSSYETTTEANLHDFDGDGVPEVIIVKANNGSRSGDILRLSVRADTLVKLQHLSLPETFQDWQVDTSTYMVYPSGSIRWFGAFGDKVDWLVGYVNDPDSLIDDGTMGDTPIGDSLIIEEIEAYPIDGDARMIMREEIDKVIKDKR